MRQPALDSLRLLGYLFRDQCGFLTASQPKLTVQPWISPTAQCRTSTFLAERCQPLVSAGHTPVCAFAHAHTCLPCTRVSWCSNLMHACMDLHACALVYV